jgi:tetratricopeptide (TPR) repeat protein
MRMATMLLLVPVLLIGCESSNSGSWTGAGVGAVVGGVAGGVIGHQSGHKWEGALIGAAAGGAGGWFIGTEMGSSPKAAPVDSSEYREAKSYYDQANRTDSPEEAIDLYDRSIGIEPNLPGPYNNKGLQYLKMGDEAMARQCFEDALKIDPDYAPARDNLRKLQNL